MSNIIKASQIVGAYKVEDISIMKKNRAKSLKLLSKDDNDYSEEKSRILLEAEKQATEIIKKAEETAASMVKESEEELKIAQGQAVEKGYQEGYEKGYQEGQAKGLEEFKALSTNFQKIIKEIKKRINEDIDNNQKNIIDLVFKISTKVINAELMSNPESINNIVIEMLGQVADIEEVKVHINPVFLEYISQDDFKSAFPRQNLEFIANKELAEGDCIVETDFGGKDGRIKNKLKLLEKELLKEAGFDDEF
ncbi:FliH/SctL family protein [Natronospora cellulosivora (SeqCode)]